MLKGERCLSLDPMAGHKIVNGVLFPSRLAWELLGARASIRHRDPGQADSQDEVALPRTVLDLVAGTPSETEIRVTHGNVGGGQNPSLFGGEAAVLGHVQGIRRDQWQGPRSGPC